MSCPHPRQPTVFSLNPNASEQSSRKNLRLQCLFEIALVFVRFDQVARVIVNADQSVVQFLIFPAFPSSPKTF
jgi:hypothetical protein